MEKIVLFSILILICSFIHVGLSRDWYISTDGCDYTGATCIVPDVNFTDICATSSGSLSADQSSCCVRRRLQELKGQQATQQIERESQLEPRPRSHSHSRRLLAVNSTCETIQYVMSQSPSDGDVLVMDSGYYSLVERESFNSFEFHYNGDGIDKTIINIDKNSSFSNDEPFFKIESTSYVTWNNFSMDIDSSLGTISSKEFFYIDSSSTVVLNNIRINGFEISDNFFNVLSSSKLVLNNVTIYNNSVTNGNHLISCISSEVVLNNVNIDLNILPDGSSSNLFDFTNCNLTIINDLTIKNNQISNNLFNFDSTSISNNNANIFITSNIINKYGVYSHSGSSIILNSISMIGNTIADDSIKFEDDSLSSTVTITINTITIINNTISNSVLGLESVRMINNDITITGNDIGDGLVFNLSNSQLDSTNEIIANGNNNGTFLYAANGNSMARLQSVSIISGYFSSNCIRIENSANVTITQMTITNTSFSSNAISMEDSSLTITTLTVQNCQSNNNVGRSIISSMSNSNFITSNIFSNNNILPNGVFYSCDSSNNILTVENNGILTSSNDIFESFFSIGSAQLIVKNYQFYNLKTIKNVFTFNETTATAIISNASLGLISCNISQFLFFANGVTSATVDITDVTIINSTDTILSGGIFGAQSSDTLNISNFEIKSGVYPDTIANISNSIVSFTNIIIDMGSISLGNRMIVVSNNGQLITDRIEIYSDGSMTQLNTSMIYVTNGATFEATNSKFYNLNSVGYGIIESVGKSEIYLDECNFTNIEINTTISGGGGDIETGAGVIYVDDGSKFGINNCRFESISTFGNGGAIYMDSGGNGTIHNCVFKNCDAANNGGDMYFSLGAGDNVNISHYVSINATAGNKGNLIYITSSNDTTGEIGDIMIEHSSFDGLNNLDSAIYVEDGSISLNYVNVSNISFSDAFLVWKRTNLLRYRHYVTFYLLRLLFIVFCFVLFRFVGLFGFFSQVALLCLSLAIVVDQWGVLQMNGKKANKHLFLPFLL